MAQASLTKNKPVGGGSERNLPLSAGVVLKIAPLRGSNLTLTCSTQLCQPFTDSSAKNTGNHSLQFDEYKQLTRYREYLCADYCISCAYFQVVKGHFGTCLDLPIRKPYDGTKKGSGCALWRLRTVYLRYGIKQQLPEKPTIRHVQLRTVKRHGRLCRRAIPKWLFSHPARHRNKDVDTPWFWRWRLPKVVYDFLNNPEPLPDSIDLREPYGHYSDKLVWKDGKYRSKKPITAPSLRTCRQCGKLFEQQPNTQGLYCSQSCFHQHRLTKLHRDFPGTVNSHLSVNSLGIANTPQRSSREMKGL